MQRTTEQHERMIRYLLGDLPETEEAAVEQEYFDDPEKFEEVWMAENELVDRYVRGRLSRGERELFEGNYLQSPKHRERVAFAVKLLKAADRSAAERGVATQIVQHGSFRQDRLTKALNSPRLLVGGLLAATTVLLIAGLALLVVERGRLNEELGRTKAQLSEQQRHEQESAGQLAAAREQSGRLKSELVRLKESLAQRPPQSSVESGRLSTLSFILSPMLARRSGREPLQQITISRETDLIRLRMKIEEGDGRTHQATIQTVEGVQVWNRRSLKLQSGAVSVNVPANKLPLGDYILTLSALTPTGEPEEINRYFFRVVRR